MEKLIEELTTLEAKASTEIERDEAIIHDRMIDCMTELTEERDIALTRAKEAEKELKQKTAELYALAKECAEFQEAFDSDARNETRDYRFGRMFSGFFALFVIAILWAFCFTILYFVAT